MTERTDMLIAKMVANEIRVVSHGRAYDHDTKTYHATEISKGEQVTLTAVYSEDPEDQNRQWAKATPCGKLELTIDNPGAQGRIEAGREYIVTIRRARPGE